mmetsp:Transcript_1881/g.2601  ORF Transcript_1881/g.2601 Transcript_1881/m.2601 type:complete len:213 (-) Transcript_1881:383-1021(-)
MSTLPGVNSTEIGGVAVNHVVVNALAGSVPLAHLVKGLDRSSGIVGSSQAHPDGTAALAVSALLAFTSAEFGLGEIGGLDPILVEGGVVAVVEELAPDQFDGGRGLGHAELPLDLRAVYLKSLCLDIGDILGTGAESALALADLDPVKLRVLHITVTTAIAGSVFGSELASEVSGGDEVIGGIGDGDCRLYEVFVLEFLDDVFEHLLVITLL